MEKEAPLFPIKHAHDLYWESQTRDRADVFDFLVLLVLPDLSFLLVIESFGHARPSLNPHNTYDTPEARTSSHHRTPSPSMIHWIDGVKMEPFIRACLR